MYSPIEFSKTYKTYDDILYEAEDPEYISYGKKLEAIEWQEKRKPIIARDKGKCVMCGKEPTERYRVGSKLKDFWWMRKSLTATEELKLNPFDFIHRFDPIASDKPYKLEVHHKYYIIDNLPWDYPDDALVTLCNWCHSAVHETERIPIYSSSNGELLKNELTPCSRCNASGYLPHYAHICNGVCFKCKGNRYVEWNKKKRND